MKENAKIAISLLIILIFGGIVALGYYQSQSQTSPLPPREQTAKYFQIVSGAVDPTGQERIEQNGTIWVIYAISVTFKPVLGDAHGVVVGSWANSEPYEVGTMLKDQPRTVSLMSQNGLAITRNATGAFNVKLNISCQEASGFITVSLGS